MDQLTASDLPLACNHFQKSNSDCSPQPTVSWWIWPLTGPAVTSLTSLFPGRWEALPVLFPDRPSPFPLRAVALAVLSAWCSIPKGFSICTLSSQLQCWCPGQPFPGHSIWCGRPPPLIILYCIPWSFICSTFLPVAILSFTDWLICPGLLFFPCNRM